MKNALESRRRTESGWQVERAASGGGEARLALMKLGHAVLVKFLSSMLVSNGRGNLSVVEVEAVAIVVAVAVAVVARTDRAVRR